MSHSCVRKISLLSEQWDPLIMQDHPYLALIIPCARMQFTLNAWHRSSCAAMRLQMKYFERVGCRWFLFPVILFHHKINTLSKRTCKLSHQKHAWTQPLTVIDRGQTRALLSLFGYCQKHLGDWGRRTSWWCLLGGNIRLRNTISWQKKNHFLLFYTALPPCSSGWCAYFSPSCCPHNNPVGWGWESESDGAVLTWS